MYLPSWVSDFFTLEHNKISECATRVNAEINDRFVVYFLQNLTYVLAVLGLFIGRIFRLVNFASEHILSTALRHPLRMRRADETQTEKDLDARIA